MSNVQPIRDPRDVLREIRQAASARLSLYAAGHHQAAQRMERDLRRLVTHAPMETSAAIHAGELKHWMPPAYRRDLSTTPTS
ncbi:hypothetical protein [Thioalkalivibrio sp. ALJ16]|uniref:hypothetical protein n=1 Tax=Thioalkalivibrio sp. ALJ16 TaxID=1158762 RepID=UPI000378E440|nr:hypothetical protein [Thioalkalivibrio sp. ALJ16]